MVRGVAVLFAGHHCPEVYLIGIVPPVLLVIMPIQTEVLLGRRRRAEHRRKNNSQDDCNSPTAHIGPPMLMKKPPRGGLSCLTILYRTNSRSADYNLCLFSNPKRDGIVSQGGNHTMNAADSDDFVPFFRASSIAWRCFCCACCAGSSENTSIEASPRTAAPRPANHLRPVIGFPGTWAHLHYNIILLAA